MSRVIKELSPQTVIDPIRTRILFCPSLHETMESLEDRTLDELFWLHEQIEVGDFLREAAEKDAERMQNNNQPSVR
tara:strand:+ start:1482 stop:1709 length:228 start_codon:yes stop_codon:yes gene_type:complete